MAKNYNKKKLGISKGEPQNRTQNQKGNSSSKSNLIFPFWPL